MNIGNSGLTAGLLFEGDLSIGFEKVIQIAGQALESRGIIVPESHYVSERHAVLQVDSTLVHLMKMRAPEGDPRWSAEATVLNICIESSTQDSHGLAPEVMLADLTMRLHDFLQPDHVFWLSFSATLTSAEFLRATQPDGERSEKKDRPSARKAKRLPKIELEIAHLQDRVQSEAEAADQAWRARMIRYGTTGTFGIIPDTPENTEPQIEIIREDNNIFRLSAWLLSIGVSMIVLPVGIALALINLIKGENLRLVSQVSALMGLFVSLSCSGASADTLRLLERLLT